MLLLFDKATVEHTQEQIHKWYLEKELGGCMNTAPTLGTF